MLTFRKAKENEVSEIFAFFKNAVAEMERQGIMQWDDLYPTDEDLLQDAKKEELYVGEIEEELCCAFVLNQEVDEQYANGKWQYPSSSYFIIHRLCVNPRFQNQGIAKRAMQYIEKTILEKGIECIRLDAYSLNPYALRLYRGLGYIEVGEAHWRKGMFYLMEKKLED